MNRRDVDHELELLLEGSAEARERHPELGTFVDDLQALPAPSPAAENLHVAAMMSEMTHLLAAKGDPAVRPVSNAHGPAWQASGLPTRRRRPMVKLLLTKVVAPLVAAVTLMGGLAYAQALPDPLQDAVAGAAGAVGINLPSSGDENQPQEGDQNDGTVGEDGTAGDEDQPQEGDTNDGTVGEDGTAGDGDQSQEGDTNDGTVGEDGTAGDGDQSQEGDTNDGTVGEDGTAGDGDAGAGGSQDGSSQGSG